MSSSTSEGIDKQAQHVLSKLPEELLELVKKSAVSQPTQDFHTNSRPPLRSSTSPDVGTAYRSTWADSNLQTDQEKKREISLDKAVLLQRILQHPRLPPSPTSISNRRGFQHSLPIVPTQATLSSLPPKDVLTYPILPLDLRITNMPLESLTQCGTKAQSIRSSSLGPPTPPQENEFQVWPVPARVTFAHDHITTHSGSQDSNLSVPNQSRADEGRMTKGLVTSSPALPPLSHSGAGQPWLLRALRVATEALELHIPTGSTRVISQVLPAQATDERPIKTYETVCEYLQQILPEPGYISITHVLAVTPGHPVESFPKSPPVTPRISGGNSYFEEQPEQTVFTYAATVPVHHEIKPGPLDQLAPIPRYITTADTSLILLERYLPPPSSKEMKDFFSANSDRSYLADRLPELAIETGSLVLMYPTKTGSQTFAKQYVAPVLDPLLREISILKGLNTNASERLGRMEAVAKMPDFEKMQTAVARMCTSLNNKHGIQRTRSEFVLQHSETINVILDRNTWMTWFVEQEQQRMKQDLVEYHKDGGRLPQAENGSSEITAGMLSREIVEGMRKSKVQTGGVDIEVGIFVIKRVKRQTGQA